MPIPAYMKITGATQGDMSAGASSADSIGALSQSSHENEIIVQQLTTHVNVGTNVQTGQAAGVRQHKPVVFTKYMDKSSPLLWQAICKGEQLTIELTFFRTATEGGVEQYYTMTWSECVLVDGKAHFPLALRTENDGISHLEDWSFVYKKVEWTHTIAGTSGADDWNS